MVKSLPGRQTSMREQTLSDLRQSPSYANYLRALGWQVDQLGETFIYSKKLPLLGVVIKIQRPTLPLPLKEIDNLAKGKKAFLVKIEPDLVDSLNPKLPGFIKDNSPILPTRTIWIDLKPSEEALFANLDKDTRNLVRRAEKDGVVVVESRDIGNFYLLWAEHAKRKRFFVPFEKEMSALWKSFDEKHLLVAKYKGEISAAAVLLGYKDTLYYSFAASSDLGRKSHATYLLLWEALRRAKGWGYRKLDLEGVADPKVGRTRRWVGFSNFKRGFGGREVQYAGSFSKYYSFWGKIFGRFI
jgi:lipid II:glycine glycyltransferase (peptidoglycan interpeptide bridge formation enzyme)